MYGNNDYRDYLEHHGILGQKWGVRRFQNEDGSLTEAGRRRYLTDDGQLTNKGMRLTKRISKDFNKSDKANAIKAIDRYYSDQNKITEQAISNIKSHDPNIGATVLMTDGKMYTSLKYKDAINKGYAVEKVNWICYGDTLESTLKMIDTSTKYGLEKEFKANYDKYREETINAILKDSKNESELGREVVSAYIYSGLNYK